jgi:solute carrier family 25 phosphate transporter 23/24/25/41
LASTLAYSFCYPLDTVKRRMQAEGSPGYKFTDTNNEINYAKQMLKAEGVIGFYKGFVPGLIRTVPMCFMQFIVY